MIINERQRAVCNIVKTMIDTFDKDKLDQLGKLQYLIEYKFLDVRMPRQSGKTLLIQEFAKQSYHPMIVSPLKMSSLYEDIPYRLRSNYVTENQSFSGMRFSPDLILMDEVKDPYDFIKRNIDRLQGPVPRIILSLRT